MTEWTDDDTLTSVEAAAALGLAASTTRNAAARGQVEGARPEPRPGTINAPWVATRAAWQSWFDSRRPMGRPAREQTEPGGVNVNAVEKPLLSRTDTVTITRAEWVPDQKNPNLYWWTIRTDLTGDAAFKTWGVHPPGGSPPNHPWEERDLTLGSTIRLGRLSFCPVATGLTAFAKIERGPVLAAIGKLRDQLDAYCGPMVYLVPQCQTRSDTVPPTDEQMTALRSALEVLVSRGINAAEKALRAAGQFENVFDGIEGCPAAPAHLTDGVFEWR